VANPRLPLSKERDMKRFWCLPLLLICFIFWASPLTAQDRVTFRVPLPLSGSYAKFADIERRSYEIAVEEINAAHGIQGKAISLEFQDSRGLPEVSKAIAEKLIDQYKQPLIFGEYSSNCSKAVATVAEAKKVPYLVVSGAADSITQPGHPFVFRMSPANAYYPSGLLSFIQEVVKPQTMVILYESSDFGTSGAEVVMKHAAKMEIKVLMKDKYEKGSSNFKPLLSRVKTEKPDVIYMVSYVNDAALLMKQIRDLQIDAKLFAGGAAGFAIPEFIQNAKEASEYIVTASLWSPQVAYPGAREFAEKYRKRHGDYPSYHGAEAYSALYVIKDVLTRANSWTPEAIRDSLKATDLMTAFGPIKFEDKEGYTHQNFMDTLVMQVINGRHETIWPVNYASKAYVYPIPAWGDRKVP
jgi:branched-chain amino acid transport system substrate-binding protein